MMALSGVRSSWLMLARNRLLVRLASSAISLARSRRASVSFRFTPSAIASAAVASALSASLASGSGEYTATTPMGLSVDQERVAREGGHPAALEPLGARQS